jgi:hypothetical protein
MGVELSRFSVPALYVRQPQPLKRYVAKRRSKIFFYAIRNFVRNIFNFTGKI